MLFGLMGSNYLFNYNESIWTLNSLECNVYFCNVPSDNALNCDFDRCSDTGFLEWLRVVGTISLVFEFVVIVISLMNYINSVPVAVGTGNKMESAGYNVPPTASDDMSHH